MLRRCQHHYDIIEAKRFPACPHLTCFFWDQKNSWTPYLLGCKPRLIIFFFIISCGLQSKAAYNRGRLTFLSLACQNV